MCICLSKICGFQCVRLYGRKGGFSGLFIGVETEKNVRWRVGLFFTPPPNRHASLASYTALLLFPPRYRFLQQDYSLIFHYF